jgi:hypothetical protein
MASLRIQVIAADISVIVVLGIIVKILSEKLVVSHFCDTCINNFQTEYALVFTALCYVTMRLFSSAILKFVSGRHYLFMYRSF